jgi:hypothetical protein
MGDRLLASRVRYNQGNVQYQQALEALRASTDAVTPLRAAMAYYRDSLEADPQYQEARYNLELAYLLLRRIQSPKDQEQRQVDDGERTKQDQEQSSKQPNQEQPSRQQKTQQDTSQSSQAQSAEHPIEQQASLDNAETQMEPANNPQELSSEEAEQLLEDIRQRGREIDKRREQWRRARLGKPRIDKDW